MQRNIEAIMPAYKYDLNLQVLCLTVFDELHFYIRKQLPLVLTAQVHRSGVTDPGKCTLSTALCLLEARTGMFRVSGLIFITNSLYKNLQDSSNRVQHTFADKKCEARQLQVI